METTVFEQNQHKNGACQRLLYVGLASRSGYAQATRKAMQEHSSNLFGRTRKRSLGEYVAETPSRAEGATIQPATSRPQASHKPGRSREEAGKKPATIRL